MKIKSLSEVLSTKINEIVIRIPIKYQDEQLFAIINGQDYNKVKDYTWSAKEVKRSSRIVYYAIRSIKNRKIFMHNVILDTANGFTVDHKDGDGLNNIRSNLRPATKHQQGANRTKSANKSSFYKGVCWCKRTGKWKARIIHNGKEIYLGTFSDEEEGAAVYDAAAIGLFGEFAKPNFCRLCGHRLNPCCENCDKFPLSANRAWPQ